MSKPLLSTGLGTKDRLTQKDIARKWGCSPRTVRREIIRHKATPCDAIGIQPVFTPATVERMEKARARRNKQRVAAVLARFKGKRGGK